MAQGTWDFHEDAVKPLDAVCEAFDTPYVLLVGRKNNNGIQYQTWAHVDLRDTLVAETLSDALRSHADMIGVDAGEESE